MKRLAIRTTRLSRDFGERRVVDGLELEIPAGTVFGFLGPNGAGKTTTIRLLLGLLDPTSGRAEVLGYDTTREATEIRLRTGVVLDHTGLYLRLSGLDNLNFFGDIWQIGKAERADRIHLLLSRFGLWDRREERVSDWSRGMRQKLAVARALLHRPSLLFLDEPTAGMDPLAADGFRRDIMDLSAEEGTTVFMTTHDLAEAEQVCDRVGVIKEGKLVADGPPTALGSDPDGVSLLEIDGHDFSTELLSTLALRPDVIGVEQVDGMMSLQLQAEGDTAAIVAVVVGAGGRVLGVRQDRSSLRESFLELMEDAG
jgi:ABC-2 type transport system ATP-binding protein